MFLTKVVAGRVPKLTSDEAMDSSGNDMIQLITYKDGQRVISDQVLVFNSDAISPRYIVSTLFEPVPVTIAFDVPATVIIPVGSDVAFPVETGLVLFAHPSSPASFRPRICNWHRESNPLKELLRPHTPRIHWSTTRNAVWSPSTTLLAIFRDVRDFLAKFFEFSVHGLVEMGIRKIALCIVVLTWACATLGHDSGELEYTSAASGCRQQMVERDRVAGNHSSDRGQDSPKGGAQCGMDDSYQPDGGSTPPSPTLDRSHSEELSADSAVERLCASPPSLSPLPASGLDSYQGVTLPAVFLHFRIVPLVFLWAVSWSFEWSENDMDILAQSLGLGPFELPPDGLLQWLEYLSPGFLASLIDERIYRPSLVVLDDGWSYLSQQWSRALPDLVDGLDFVMDNAALLPLALVLFKHRSRVVQSPQYAQVLSFAATVHHWGLRLASQSRYYGLIQSYPLGLETSVVASSLIVPCILAATEELLEMVTEAVWRKEFGANWRRPGARPRSRPQKGFPWKLLVKHCWEFFRSLVAPPLEQLKSFIVLDIWPVFCAVGTVLRTTVVILANAAYIVATLLYISSGVLAKIVSRAVYLAARALAYGSARALLASLDLTEQYELWRVWLQNLSPMWCFLPDLMEGSRPTNSYQESPPQRPQEVPVQQEVTAHQERPFQQDQAQVEVKELPEAKEEQPTGGKILYYNLDERRALRGSTYFNPKSASTPAPRDFRWLDPSRGDKRFYPVGCPSPSTPPRTEAVAPEAPTVGDSVTVEAPSPAVCNSFKVDIKEVEVVVDIVETPLDPEVHAEPCTSDSIDAGHYDAEEITAPQTLWEPEVLAEPCTKAIDEGHADSEGMTVSEALDLYKASIYEDPATAMARLEKELEDFLREDEVISDVDQVVPDLCVDAFDESYTEVLNTFESLLGVSLLSANTADEDDSVVMTRLDQELEDAFGQQTVADTSNWDIFTPLPWQPRDVETPQWLITRTPPPIASDETEPPTPCTSIPSSPCLEGQDFLELNKLTDLSISGGRVTPPTPTPLGRSPSTSLAKLSPLTVEGTPVSTTTYDFQSEERNQTLSPRTPAATWTSGLAESRWSPLNCATTSLETTGVEDYRWSPESYTPPVSPPTPGKSSNELLALRERALVSRRGRAPSPPGTPVPVESSTELSSLRERALLSRRGRAPSPPGTPVPVESSTELVLCERAPSPWTPPTPGEPSNEILSLRTPSPGSCGCSTPSTTPRTVGPIRHSSRRGKGRLVVSTKGTTGKMIKQMERAALSMLEACEKAKDFGGRNYGYQIEGRTTRMEEIIQTGIAVETRFIELADEEPLLPSMESIEQELVDIAVLDGIAMNVDDPLEMLPKLHPGAPMDIEGVGYHRSF
ncbi:hypothetical protein MD484_g5310, partial [Candolleomyces efflorescens]